MAVGLPCAPSRRDVLDSLGEEHDLVGPSRRRILHDWFTNPSLWNWQKTISFRARS